MVNMASREQPLPHVPTLVHLQVQPIAIPDAWCPALPLRSKKEDSPSKDLTGLPQAQVRGIAAAQTLEQIVRAHLVQRPLIARQRRTVL